MIITAIVGLYRPNLDMTWWFAGLAVFGAIVVIPSTWMAMGQLAALASRAFRYSGAVSIGDGGVGMLVGLGVLGVLSFVASGKRTPRETMEQTPTARQ